MTNKILIIKHGSNTGVAQMISDFCKNVFSTNNYDTEILFSSSNIDSLDNVKGIVFVMPEYNGSFPSQFKLLIDNSGWPSQFKDMKFFLIGLSGGQFGNKVGVSHMTDILHHIDADVFKKKLCINNDLANDPIKFDNIIKEFTQSFIDYIK